jgi:hypothetical protein
MSQVHAIRLFVNDGHAAFSLRAMTTWFDGDLDFSASSTRGSGRRSYRQT